MKLLFLLLNAMFALAFGKVIVVSLEFRNVSVKDTGRKHRYETSVSERLQGMFKNYTNLLSTFFNDKCQSGEVKSKYCTTSEAECFGSEGQNVYVKFARKFKETPKVMIGLTLIDTNKDQNVRVRAEVTHVTRIGFNIRFKPWDKSITYQIGVNWMACL